MTRVVDKKKNIINPVVYGRSKEKCEEGDVCEFRTNGWRVKARVLSVRPWEDERFQSSDGYYVYQIYDCERLEWIGLEGTEEEEEDWKKEAAKKNQTKLDI
jgi:hypothetical protein